MTVLHLKPGEAPLVRAALLAIAEAHEMDADNRHHGHDDHVNRELHDQAATLTAIAERIRP